MAEQRLNDNATSLEAANWSGAGFADGAELAIVGNEETIADLDRSADTTNGINYLHIRNGRPTVGGDSETDLIIECAVAYTTRPNFIWATRGGLCRVQFATTVCNEAVFMASGGDAYIVAGNVDKLKIAGSGNVTILAGAEIDSELWVAGEAVVTIQDSGTAIPIAQISERARVHNERAITEVWQRQASWFYNDNRSGTGTTTYKLEGGIFVPVAGDVADVEWFGGRIDDTRVEQALELGATAFEVRGSGLVAPRSAGLLTVSNVNSAYPTPLSK